MTTQDKRLLIFRSIFAIGIAGCLIAILFTGKGWTHNAMSGQVYPGWCCQGTSGISGHGDCAQIPSSDVRATANGWVITLKPGDHPLATRPHIFTKRYGEQLKSDDGEYHLCLYPNEDNDRCFLAPEPGV